MNKFFIQISLSERRIKRRSGFESPSVQRYNRHLVVRTIVNDGPRTFFCAGHFYDGCLEQDLLLWLKQFDERNPGGWLKKRDGDFFVILYDQDKNTVTIFSDQNGQLRLYYSLENRDVLISNSLVQMAASLNRARLSNLGVFFLLKLKFSVDPYTLLENVQSSMPGTYTEIGTSGCRTEHYYDPVALDSQYFEDMSECVDGLDSAFRSTFQKRYDQSKDCLVLLSGGIDSVAMLRYLTAVGPGRVRAFTLGLATDREGAEIRAAQTAAAHFGIQHDVYLLNPEDVTSYVADCFTDADGPHYGNAMWLCIKSAAKDILGNSYVFSGQDTRLHTPTFDFPKQLGILFSRENIPPAAKNLAKALLNLTQVWPLRGKNTLAYWRQVAKPRSSLQEYYLEALLGYSGSRQSPLYETLVAEVPHLSLNVSLQEMFKKFITFEYRSQFTDDMNSMVSTLEDADTKVHLPFYDHEVVEMCNRIPYHLGARQIFTLKSWSWVPFTQKAVMRQLLLQHVPPEVVFRRKATLPSIQDAFNGRLRSLAVAILDRWGSDLRDALDEDNRAIVLASDEEFRASARYTFVVHHDLLWRIYCVAYMAVLNQICQNNSKIVDEIRDMADEKSLSPSVVGQ